MTRPAYAPALDALKAALRDVGGTHTLYVDGLTGPSLDKVLALKATGRDVFALTESVAQTVRNHFKSAFEYAAKRGDLAAVRSAPVEQQALRRVFALRLPGGNDVHFDPLKPSTVARKRRLGQPLTPGVATEALRNNILRATFGLLKK